VQHEIVSGLCFVNSVYKGPIKVTTDKVRKRTLILCGLTFVQEMLGSYGPKAEPYVCTTPRRGWEEAPTGAMYRGNFKVCSCSACFAFLTLRK
jgi:hypothetical protein